MSLRIGDIAPDFSARTTEGTLQFHEWIGDSWAILFSHPKDFTPVCTTELGYMAGLEKEFASRGCKVIGMSTDPLEDHEAWKEDIAATQGHRVQYPLISDEDLTVAKRYEMLPAEAMPGERSAVDNQTVRSVFVIGPDKRIKAMMAYPMTCGRNFDEILRLLDAVQLTETHVLATPVNWVPGEECIIPPSVTSEAAAEKYPQGFRTVRPYLRYVEPVQ